MNSVRSVNNVNSVNHVNSGSSSYRGANSISDNIFLDALASLDFKLSLSQ